MNRKYWVDTLIKIAEPVLKNMAEGKLKEKMPMEKRYESRKDVMYLEAIGRTLAGVAPWLENPAADKDEEEKRAYMAELARKAIANAVDEESPDYCAFYNKDNQQPLVDAAFLCQGILRAPNELWKKLDEKTKERLVFELESTRSMLAYRNNWLLFAAMIEAALFMMTGRCDQMRIEYSVFALENWYKGDGTYGDGIDYSWDYYNSYVIHPMLVDLKNTLGSEMTRTFSDDRILKRAKRYAAIQERMIAPDGSFAAVGRSISYRTGAFHALAQASLLKNLPDEVAPAQVRAALGAVIKRCFEAQGTFDENGWLRIGLCGHQESLAETYISVGSLYLCCAVFLPLGLSESDPFWSDPDCLYTAQKLWSGVDIPADHAVH